MSSAFKHPLPVNSDESNSTEHDATVSLSGTDEINDNQSIFSDTGSRTSRVNDTRKAIHKMNKLKEENALLKEALEKANATDITTLKSKLRGSHADLVRLRQNNSELKDRIQILEGRLFTALSMSSTAVKSSSDSNSGNEVDRGNMNALELGTTLPTQFIEPPQKERFTSGDRAHLMDMIRSLQSRCKHLARLVQSYETKMSVLQSEVDASKASVKSAPTAASSDMVTNSIDFTLDTIYQNKEHAFSEANELSNAPLKSALKGKSTAQTTITTENITTASGSTDNNNHSTISTTPPTSKIYKPRVKMQQEEIDSQIQQARTEDLKLIRELSNEVRRLVALIPREKMDNEIDQDRKKSNNNVNESNKPEHEQNEDSAESEPESSEIDTKRDSNTHLAKETTHTKGLIMNKTNIIADNHAMQYTHGDVLCSFFVGIVVMMICVALSTYFTTQLSGAEPSAKT